MPLFRPTTPAVPPADQAGKARARRLWRWARRPGATAVEYAVMLSLIIAVCVVAIRNFGGASGAMFSNDAAQIPPGTTGS
jgi:Flp pilus assembly pilin Flp